jgi:hypothetical protein
MAYLKNLSFSQIISNKDKQDTTNCVYCVIHVLMIRLNYHLTGINLYSTAYIACLLLRRFTMIEQILKLREEGLSFRKIALELSTTVGRIQYRYNKWLQEHSDHASDISLNKEMKSSENLHINSLQVRGGALQLKVLSPRKIMVSWEVSKIPKKLIQIYFNQNFESLVHVLRIYDVKDIMFNGNNAHYFHEIAIPYQNGHWFIKGLRENRSYISEMGVYLNDTDVFFPILRSNSIQTLLDNERFDKIDPPQTFKDEFPKWKDHVSTYSYYEETKILEGKNEKHIIPTR